MRRGTGAQDVDPNSERFHGFTHQDLTGGEPNGRIAHGHHPVSTRCKKKIFGVLFKCLEIYLTMAAVHALLSHYLVALRAVFVAARCNITFNPKKCKFLFTNALGLTLTKTSEMTRQGS
jgi:hypothetical protein